MGRGFAEGSRRVVRMTLAEADILDRETFHSLALDPDPVVRATIARRPDLSVAIMTLLAGDRRASVRSTLAENPAIMRADQALRTLLDDRSGAVAESLARNPEMSREVLEKLLFHHRRSVRTRAQHAIDGTEPGAITVDLRPVGARVHGASFAS